MMRTSNTLTFGLAWYGASSWSSPTSEFVANIVLVTMSSLVTLNFLASFQPLSSPSP